MVVNEGHSLLSIKHNNLKIAGSSCEWYVAISILIFSIIASACSDYLSDPSRFKAYKMTSESMAPTLMPGERILVDVKYYRDHKPERGDIVLFEYPEDPSRDWLKRVIAMEKDVVRGKNKKIYLNGRLLEESYVRYTRNEVIPELDNFGPITISKGTLFVLGDSRDQSIDSRHFGVISVEKVKGKAVYLYWSGQLSRIGARIE